MVGEWVQGVGRLIKGLSLWFFSLSFSMLVAERRDRKFPVAHVPWLTFQQGNKSPSSSLP